MNSLRSNLHDTDKLCLLFGCTNRSMDASAKEAQRQQEASAEQILELKRELLAARKDAEVPEPPPT